MSRARSDTSSAASKVRRHRAVRISSSCRWSGRRWDDECTGWRGLAADGQARRWLPAAGGWGAGRWLRGLVLVLHADIRADSDLPDPLPPDLVEPRDRR